jgi:hypothetical protein
MSARGLRSISAIWSRAKAFCKTFRDAPRLLIGEGAGIALGVDGFEAVKLSSSPAF